NLRFNESINGYGHEDTLFGLQLQDSGVKIQHIDNPAIHAGIDEDEAFLAKTNAALETLAELYTRKLLLPHQVTEIRLLHLWERLQKYWITDRILHLIP